MVGVIKKKKTSSKPTLWIVLMFAVICLLLGILLLAKYTEVEKVFNLATSAKPETFTELYFEDHQSLPNEVTLSKKNNFRFVIHNIENKDMEYPYEVYFDINGEKKIIYINSVFVKNTEYKIIPVDFTITTQIQKAKVVVNLINKKQQISFWIEEK
jgi:hypothetical protein